ncbi:MAG: GNAT family N-acetyltransferase [Catonella sp.]|uniref:GNAT family N-acetyltransferase n=1 Tax=Catonella sp. TaxID=2382125 RepID=UPI003F9FB046
MRTLDESYAPAVCNFYNKNYDWLSAWEPNLSKHFLSIPAMEKFMKAEFKNMLLETSLRYWFSLKTSPNIPIGSVNFQGIKKGVFKSCQIGYKIDRDFSGEGLTTEAVRCAISHLFTDEKLHRIEALIATDNLISIKVIENLGFSKEGIKRECVNINGNWKNCFQYSLLNGEL